MITNLEVLGGGGSGPAVAGVKSLNGQKGDLNLKTLNGNDILGEGDVKVGKPEAILNIDVLEDSLNVTEENYRAFTEVVEENGGIDNVNVDYRFLADGEPIGYHMYPVVHSYNSDDDNITSNITIYDGTYNHYLSMVLPKYPEFIYQCAYSMEAVYTAANKQVVVLSQEEYDALPEEEKNNGKIYGIQ